MKFYPIKAHPDALRFEILGGSPMEGIVPRRVINAILESGRKPLDTFLPVESHGVNVSLPENAVYWPVPTKDLLKGEVNEDFWDLIPGWQGRLDDPNYTLIHKSWWDGLIWDIHGQQLQVPISLEVWGTHYDLEHLESYLKGHPNVVSFEIHENRCWQNWEICGREQGQLVIDPIGLDLPKGASRGWIEDHVVKVYEPGKYDVLGIHQFKRKDKD